MMHDHSILKEVGAVALIQVQLPDGRFGYVVRIGRSGHWGGESLQEAENEFARAAHLRSGSTRRGS
jgi:hypothetical protein